MERGTFASLATTRNELPGKPCLRTVCRAAASICSRRIRRVSALNLAVRYRAIGVWTVVLYFGRSLNPSALSSAQPALCQGGPHPQARAFPGPPETPRKSGPRHEKQSFAREGGRRAQEDRIEKSASLSKKLQDVAKIST